MLVVHRLAGILFEMQPLDADLDLLELALGIRADGNRDDALADDRILELRDLVALRQVRIEIVLPVEHRAVLDLGLEAEAGAHRLAHAFLVDHRQHARHGRVDEADMIVGRAAEIGRGAREQLRLGCHLGVDLHADDDLPVAGGAGDEVLRIGRSGVDEGHGRVQKLKMGCQNGWFNA